MLDLRHVLLVASLLSILAAQAPPRQTQELVIGQSIARDLAGGEKHSYQVNAPKGFYGRVVVEQRGIDIIAGLADVI